jgi:hypothetical protein
MLSPSERLCSTLVLSLKSGLPNDLNSYFNKRSYNFSMVNSFPIHLHSCVRHDSTFLEQLFQLYLQVVMTIQINYERTACY